MDQNELLPPPGFAGGEPAAAPVAHAEEWGMRGQEAVMRIPVEVRIVLGATKMSVAKLMSLTRGSVIPLDRKVGDMVDIVVNDQTVARGEIIVLDQEADRFAVSIREVVKVSQE